MLRHAKYGNEVFLESFKSTERQSLCMVVQERTIRVRRFLNRILIGVALLCTWSVAFGESSDGQSHYRERIIPLLKTYCYECHGGGAKEGNLALDQFATASDALQSRELRWKVFKNLRAGVMPPAGEKKPSSEEIEQIA